MVELNEFGKFIQKLKDNNTFLIYNNEETWCSDGIDPINAVITNIGK